MKYVFYSILLLSANMALATTIYDVQYTEDAGNGTYPSPLNGQEVTLSGVVSAIGYHTARYFISTSSGGPWNGLLIWDYNTSIQPGDLVELSGTVTEYNGHTELIDLTNTTVISSGNPLPPVWETNCQAITDSESLEGVLTVVRNLTVTQGQNGLGEWHVSDTSGSCQIDDIFFDLAGAGVYPAAGDTWAAIYGIADYQYGEHALNPRFASDLVGSLQDTVISAPDLQTPLGVQITIPINISTLDPDWGVQSFSLALAFNETVLDYVDFSLAACISHGGTATVVLSNDLLQIEYSSDFPLSGAGAIIKLDFNTVLQGTSLLDLQDIQLNSLIMDESHDGSLEVLAGVYPVADTLTVIQRPLLTIPEISRPGDYFDIYCQALESCSNFNASALRAESRLDLEIQTAVFEEDLGWWRLNVLTPEVPFYGLFDLEISADGIETDTSSQALNFIPEFRDTWYFAHITDTHLPTNMYWTEPGSETDSSSVNDLRAIMADLSLINPAFVLITGDLIHEGELENFLWRRYYSRTKDLLNEFDVPIYLMSGNHDIGGWQDTPEPDGTARSDWHRFFGWKMLLDPPVAYPYFTQNYSFDYAGVHVTTMEAYDNYDEFWPHIYGETSFTNGQLDWLDLDLASNQAETYVLAYHNDFANQINLNQLGVDLALWGHIHSDSGNINSHPYDLATDQATNGGRAFRIIKVNENELAPRPTLHSGNNGQNLSISYNPENDGNNDTVTATVTNTYNENFETALIRFLLPAGLTDCNTSSGQIDQIYELDGLTYCEVSYNLASSSTQTITVNALAPEIGVPQNLQISMSGSAIILNWDSVAGAQEYRVYSSSSAFHGFSDISQAGEFNGNSWQTQFESNIEFFRVSAIR
jgi:hypothetical protein